MVKDFTIIIADDDGDDRQFISDALRRSQFDGLLQCVTDGNKLLEALKSATGYALPDLILLDLNMPFKDGIQALQEIKQDGILKTIPTIVITTSSSRAHEQKCYELGAAGFFSKPLSIPDYDRVAAKIMSFIHSA